MPEAPGSSSQPSLQPSDSYINTNIGSLRDDPKLSANHDGELSQSPRFQDALNETVGALRESLWDFMPDGAYRDFYAWALSDTNPQRDTWLQVTGATQIVQLTVKLMSGFLDDHQWKRLARHNAPFNLYLIYEVVSDNLAIGLAYQNPKRESTAERQWLLHHFNRITADSLSGSLQVGETELNTLRATANSISSFAQSLSPGKQAGVVRAYQRQYPEVPSKQIEYSIWSLLVANFKSCIATMERAEQLHTAPIIRHGLIQRYLTVDALLFQKLLSLDQLTSYSAYAILLVPTIAYYLDGFAEVISLGSKLPRIVENGMLSEALYLTAFLVRLLNDFGTQLLFLSAEERMSFLEQLHKYVARRDNSQTLSQVLLHAASENATLLTRLKKDIQHGELNLGLWYLANVTPVSDAIMLFAHRLEFFSYQYTFRYAQLHTLLENISEQLGDETLSNLISNCVTFHENLYRNPYDAPDGEYAV